MNSGGWTKVVQTNNRFGRGLFWKRGVLISARPESWDPLPKVFKLLDTENRDALVCLVF